MEAHKASALACRTSGKWSLTTADTGPGLAAVANPPASDNRAATPQAHASSESQAELRKFAALAAEWWNPHGAFQPLHAMNPTRCSFIRSALCELFRLETDAAEPLRGLSILDVGCGGGLLSEPLARLGATVVGIEPTQDNLQAARLHVQQDPALQQRVSYEATTAEQLAAQGRHFDAVCALEVIEHVNHASDFAATLAALTRPDGALFVSTLNRTPQAYMLAIVGAERIVRLLPAGTHDWNKFVMPAELDMMLQPHGLQLQHIAGMAMDMLRGSSWYLSDNISVNYIACFQKQSPL